MFNFIETIKQFPISYSKFEDWFKNQMIEPPKNEDMMREIIYDFIKKYAFRVYIDHLSLASDQRVIVQLYFAGNFINAYERLYNQNEIYNSIFHDAFEEMEKWYQQIQKELENESKENVLVLL